MESSSISLCYKGNEVQVFRLRKNAQGYQEEADGVDDFGFQFRKKGSGDAFGLPFSKEDLACAPPEFFSRASDIMAAISIAEEKLALIETEEYEIQLKETIVPKMEEIPGQVTIWDILPREHVEQSESELKTAA